jgi:hypothetical protein
VEPWQTSHLHVQHSNRAVYTHVAATYASLYVAFDLCPCLFSISGATGEKNPKAPLGARTLQRM